eukprot:scaffold48_cov311-Pinguiococcus_pyrenoidosus.AAC.289
MPERRWTARKMLCSPSSSWMMRVGTWPTRCVDGLGRGGHANELCCQGSPTSDKVYFDAFIGVNKAGLWPRITSFWARYLLHEGPHARHLVQLSSAAGAQHALERALREAQPWMTRQPARHKPGPKIAVDRRSRRESI